jgi:hypothetical protein
MNADSRHECAHTICHCEVAEADQFCSERCRLDATSPSSGVAEAFAMKVCTCGHAVCAKHGEGDQVQ